MLYRQDWHEPLTDRGWDEAWVRDAVASLVADAVAAYRPDTFWPEHPDDAWGETMALTLYSGASGMIWALSCHYFPLAYLALGPALIGGQSCTNSTAVDRSSAVISE